MSWAKVALEKHLDLISGPAFKSANFTENEVDIPLVKGDNISQGYIDWNKSKYWPQNDVEKYSQYWLEEGDVILAMDRPWVTAGLKYSWIKPNDPRALLVQRVARMRGQNGLLTDYLRYIVSSKHFSDYIKNIMGGTNVPHISGKQIKAYEISLPPESTQEEIVKHLNNYDDLIENNKRRIELLEDSARQLYKEWFVRFRFPGHEHIKVIDGIPEGWKLEELSELCHFRAGGTFKLEYQGRDEGEIPFIKVRDMNSPGNKIYIIEADNWVTEDECSSFRGKAFAAGAIVFAKIGEALKKNRVRLISQNTLIDNNMMGAIPNKDKANSFYLYMKLKSLDFGSISGGAAVPFLSAKALGKEKVIVPSKLILDEFGEVTEAIYSQIENLQRQIVYLQKARNLLLPKLIGGEIAV
ncbi:hypothetical protein MAH1_14060 [Sessilibacter sp. MAH1]